MKRIFFALMLVISLGVFSYEHWGKPSAPAQPEAVQALTQPVTVPKEVPVSGGSADQPPAGQTQARVEVQPRPKRVDSSAHREPEDFAEYEQLLDEMYLKALPTAEDTARLAAMANSPVFQRTVFATIGAQGVKAFDFKEEKLRFKHQAYLEDMHRYGNDATKAKIRQRLDALIFSTDFLDLPDVKLKQSLAGDKVDFLRFIQARYPDAFADMKDRIRASDDRLLNYCLDQV